MAQLYADEDFHYGIVVRLRALGHDVLTVQEAGRRGSKDAAVLADATAQNRAVLTCNRFHFERLHQQDSSHAGIISCSQYDDLDGLAARIDQAIAASSSLGGQHLRVDKSP